jgi:hypothetical protein
MGEVEQHRVELEWVNAVRFPGAVIVLRQGAFSDETSVEKDCAAARTSQSLKGSIETGCKTVSM